MQVYYIKTNSTVIDGTGRFSYYNHIDNDKMFPVRCYTLSMYEDNCFYRSRLCSYTNNGSFSSAEHRMSDYDLFNVGTGLQAVLEHKPQLAKLREMTRQIF